MTTNPLLDYLAQPPREEINTPALDQIGETNPAKLSTEAWNKFAPCVEISGCWGSITTQAAT